jgi:hypothetical protein
MKIRAALALAVVAVLWTSLPASAKGPSQGIITGPGLVDPIVLREPGSRGIGPDLSKVAMESGFFEGAWGGDPDHGTGRPVGDLGPRYTITYDMAISDRRSDTIVQYVYPYAEPKPVTHMPAKQPFWGTQETVGGWYVARVGFRETLIGLGLPAAAPSPSASPAGIGMASATVPSQGDPIPSRLWIGAAVLALMLAAVLIRRHGVRPPVHG